MTTSSVRLALALLVAVAIGSAVAENEELDAHAKANTRTVDGTDVRPSTTAMDHGDVVSFLNYSTHPVRGTFTEPSDLEKKIRVASCTVRRKAPRPRNFGH